jgi:hypothetical protein
LPEAAIRFSAPCAVRIISMLASTSLARKRLMSAPAQKNFSLALRITTTRDVASAAAASMAAPSSVTISMS